MHYPSADTLAIVTNTSAEFYLQFYDVARHDGRRATARAMLTRRAPGEPAIEHTFASFSPDGILLALSRTDNIISLYDVRFMLSKSQQARPIAQYEHPSKEYSAGYGISGLNWVEGFGRGSLGLLTAGSDGAF